MASTHQPPRRIFYLPRKPTTEIGRMRRPRVCRAEMVEVRSCATASADPGTGKGTNSVIEYTPDMWGPGPTHKTGPASKPDEVLFHEIIHACREMRGVMNDVAVNRGYDDQNEYMAV